MEREEEERCENGIELRLQRGGNAGLAWAKLEVKSIECKPHAGRCGEGLGL